MLHNNFHEKKLYYVARIIVSTWLEQTVRKNYTVGKKNLPKALL